jgi:hypothetical protein
MINMVSSWYDQLLGCWQRLETEEGHGWKNLQGGLIIWVSRNTGDPYGKLEYRLRSECYCGKTIPSKFRCMSSQKYE